MNREYFKKKARSRDCSCVAGKDRDSNFNEVIDELCDYYEEKMKLIQEIALKVIEEEIEKEYK